MGRRLLLLLLGLFMLLDFLQALKCYNCTYVNPDGSCKNQRTTCQAIEKQKCIMRKYYKDGRIQYARQFCGYMCGPETVNRGNKRLEISCCTNRDFCNTSLKP